MPLPRYQARESAETRVRVPHVPIPSVGPMFEAWREVAKGWEDARGLLQKQQEQLDIVTMTAQYDADIASLRQTLNADPDFLQHEHKFIQGAMKIDESLTSTVTSPSVAQALRLHINKTLPMHAVTVRTEALKGWQGAQRAQFDVIADQLSHQASQTVDPLDSEETIKRFNNLVDDAKVRILTPEDAERRKVSFRTSVLERRMDYLRRTDRDEFYRQDLKGAFAAIDPLKRLEARENARKDAERDETNRERAFKLVTEEVERTWSALANQGQLPRAWLESALAGTHPYIGPDKAREYDRIMKNPPLDSGSEAADIIMQEYYGGTRTRPRVASARMSLNRLLSNLGHPNETIKKYLNELQSDEDAAESLELRRIEVGQKEAADLYQANKPSTLKLPGPIGDAQRNREKAREAEIRQKVRRGADPKAAAKEAIEKDKAERDAIPQRKKNVYELLNRE